MYIYRQAGTRGPEFGEKLKSSMPEDPDSETDSVFWSTKYSNFVVRSEYAERAEKALREHYGSGAEIAKNSSWAPKPNRHYVEGGKTEKSVSDPSVAP